MQWRLLGLQAREKNGQEQIKTPSYLLIKADPAAFTKGVKLLVCGVFLEYGPK